MNNRTICYLIILIQFIFHPFVKAQLKEYRIYVYDSSHAPIPGVAVSLVDSTQTQWAITDSSGLAQFPAPLCVTCRVRCSMLGYHELDSVIDFSRTSQANIVLTKNTRQLQTVEIKSMRPVITSSHEKIIVNWSSLSSMIKGETVWDLLKQSPLVEVDHNEQINILHRHVVIYINGKKEMMSASALINFLKNIPASKILQFEIIPIPTSAYDVGPGDAVVNIVIKKDLADHLEGQANFWATQNSYFNPTGNIQFTGKIGKLSFIQTNYGGLSGSRSLFTEQYSENLSGYQMNDSVLRAWRDMKYLGTDWYLNGDLDSVQNLSLHFSYEHDWVHPFNPEYYSFSYFSNYTVGSSPDSTGKTTEDTYDKNDNMCYAFQYLVSLLKNKLKLNIDAGQIHYYDYTDQYTLNKTMYQNKTDTPLHILQSINQKVHNTSAFLRFQYTLSTHFTLSAGMSTYFTKNFSDVNWYKYQTNQFVYDSSQSYTYQYSENTYSPFLNIDGEIGKIFTITIGAKYQIARISGKQNQYSILDRNTNDLFPTLILNFGKNQDHQFTYSITSSVNWPDFWELSPLRYYSSANNFIDNNPHLSSSQDLNQTLRYTLRQRHQFVLSYDNNKYGWGQYVYFLPNHNINLTRVNFAYTRSAGLYYISQFAFFDNHVQVNPAMGIEYNATKGQDTVLADYARFNGVAQCHMFFMLNEKKSWTAGLNLAYRSRSLSGIYELKGLFSCDMSLAKSYKNWNIRLAIYDPFKLYSLHTQVLTPLPYNMKLTGNYDSRYVSLHITYTFWNHQIRVEKKSSILDDIQNRLGH
ncbi:Outer membrane protein beta-barrel family protein [Thermoflavifilum thermophilum]|uniref:Outer membrane protein beta-barrel family protein n=2 Tax=Thermoflavifilum thermophilum TaxID=1393122 RepID=A0A1I7NLZ2_9BACT|nr:Outer membrane protein beta-barrel family protein [Thermoflavifilum thermophilum]